MKLIFKTIFIMMMIAAGAYLSHIITRNYYQNHLFDIEQENNQKIIEANNKTIFAKIDKEYWQKKCKLLQKQLESQFDEINYEIPSEKWQNTGGKVADEYIHFVPDYLPDLDSLFLNDYRKANICYKYNDNINKYAVDFNIEYSHLFGSFTIKPTNIRYIPEKKYLFCLNAFYNIDSAGLRLDYDLWRFRISSSAGFTKEIDPMFGLGIGWRF